MKNMKLLTGELEAMCRVLSYLGELILLDDLIYNPDNSLIKQTVSPMYMSKAMLNIAGFGFVGWEKKQKQPYLYKTYTLPFYDTNLKSLSARINLTCMICHARGVPYSEKHIVSNQNVHPFKFDNTEVAFAHNGNLFGFEDIRFEMMKYMKPHFKNRIQGTTDSEWMYTLFLSQLPENNTGSITAIFSAIIDSLMIIKKIRKKNKIFISSSLNFFISNGNYIVASRIVLDYGHYPTTDFTSSNMLYHSLWYTYGSRYGFYDNQYKMLPGKKLKSIIIASEPLTLDTTTWIEAPECNIIGAELNRGEIDIQCIELML